MDPELWGCVIFGPKMVHLPRTFLFWKIINFHRYQSQNYHYHNDIIIVIIIIILIYPLVPFIGQNLKKKLFQGIQSNEDAHFLGPKWPIFSNENFFRKPVNEPCFFSSCLSTCQKSKWDINLLMSYWRLKNTEISLAESLFWL